MVPFVLKADHYPGTKYIFCIDIINRLVRPLKTFKFLGYLSSLPGYRLAN